MQLTQFSTSEVGAETETEVLQHLEAVRNLLPFLVSLSAKERQRLVKLSRKRVDFVDRGLVHARSNTQYVPPYVNLEGFAKAMELSDCMHRMYVEVRSLHESFRDTVMLLASEIYAAARIFYNTVKTAAKEGGPDAEIIARDLAYHYKKSPSDKEEGEAGEDEPAEG